MDWMTRARGGAAALVAAMVVAYAAPLQAQTAPSVGPDSVVVAPGARYRTGGLHAFLFGKHYRDLWVTPIRVEVLDLDRFAGGLRPTKRGGGKQTKSLRFEGADGRGYQFRSIDKDPSQLLH
jgi:hypothetical protein